MWSTSPELWAPTHPHPGLLLINRSQGHMPARKYTPGYANSQQKFRERVQAGMTPKNRILAHSGKKPDHKLPELMELSPGEREVLTQPLSAPKLALHRGAESLTTSWGREIKKIIMEVMSIHRRGRKIVRCMKIYLVRSKVFVPPPAEVFVPSQEQQEAAQGFIRLA